LVAVVERLIQSGIVDWYYVYKSFLDNLRWIRKSELMEYNDNFPKLFKMADWKILSVFICWAVLLFMTLLAFGFEYFPNWKLKISLVLIFQYVEIGKSKIQEYWNWTLWVES